MMSSIVYRIFLADVISILRRGRTDESTNGLKDERRTEGQMKVRTNQSQTITEPRMESNPSIILHQLLPLVLLLLLTVAEVTSLARRPGSGTIQSSSSSEFYFDYYTLEELPVANLVGNVIIDFGLDLKYNQTLLSG